MSLLQHGLQKLVLINSAGYSYAELPLDASVSLIAPNNTGKTSLINALQFLLIIDKSKMDFGAYQSEDSRKFYFPDNSSYILLEVLLPTGMAVIGCVGKGLGHEYEYFAYQGSLDSEDYRLSNNQLISQPKLIAHLTERGKLARVYKASDLKAMLYGSNKQRLKNDDLDLTIFPLASASFAPSYQRILARTLRLDKLSSTNVKEYLLEIFKQDMTDSTVDFKKVWDDAFAAVNERKRHFDAVNGMKAEIDNLEKKQVKRKLLRGKLIVQRPEIETALINWQTYYRERTETLVEQLKTLKQQDDNLTKRVKDNIREQGQAENQEKELKKLEKQYIDLQFQFSAVKNFQQLEHHRESLQTQLYDLVADIKQANTRSPESINRELINKRKELTQCQQELANLHDNFYLRLQRYLPAPEFKIISCLFSKNTLTLSAGDNEKVQFFNEANFKVFAEKLTAIINQDTLQFAGLRLNTDTLSCELTLKNPQELNTEIEEIQQAITQLTQLLATANDLENRKQQQRQLEQKIKQLDDDIKKYQELSRLENNKDERQQQLKELSKQLAALKQEDHQFEHNHKLLTKQREETQASKVELENQHQRIDNIRRNRQDKQHSIDYLIQLPYIPNILEFRVNMVELATQLGNYNNDYERLLKLDNELKDGLHYLHGMGITKYRSCDSSEQELDSLFNFKALLAKEEQVIAGEARTAVINVSLLLRGLSTDLDALKRRMNDFNKLINKRQLSDLKTFKIEAREDITLVEAIKTLISTSEKLESGESFDLFNHHTVLDDKLVNKAKDFLIKKGEVLGELKVEHLFNLKFILAKENKPAKEHDDIDNAASNGTILMAKLITGLALLKLMQDERKKIHTVCYLDEAASLDQHNQRNLIATAAEFGFALIFASPEAQITARYCVPIRTVAGKNKISRKDWQIFEPL